MKDFRKYQLARSYFNTKEYLRASYYLSDCESPISSFLCSYSKYMTIMKKCIENKSDLFSNLNAIYSFDGF